MTNKEEGEMSTEENKAIVRRGFEEMNKRNLDGYIELFAPDYVSHQPGRDLRGPEPMRQYAAMIVTAFPDLHFTIEDMVAEGDKVAVRITGKGTHKGEFLGIAPTGKQATWGATNINRIVGGKFVETWEQVNVLAILQQLGAYPPPG